MRHNKQIDKNKHAHTDGMDKVEDSVGNKYTDLVVMGDHSCSRGRWFESRHHILYGHDIFSH